MDSYGVYTGGPTPPVTQITTGLIIVAVVFISGFIVEGLLKSSTDRGSRFQTVLDYTASSETSVTVRQNPKYSDAITLGTSVNERTGIEFAYSFWLFVNPSTFTGDDVLKHVFHKGYPVPWPLMAPAVFIKGSSNTMRVVMNTSNNPYTYVDVQNIPVQKWFHIVLNCFKGGLDIYINGTLATRIPFKDTIPYQNFQDVIIFSGPNFTFRKANIAALENDIEVRGAMQGFISLMKYARYALSMSEIQKQLSEGPSSKRKSSEMSIPPYLADSWYSAAHRSS